ncbi:MAG TPA: VTT domain-containing protein [Armatimonadota bacterium]
MLAGVYQELYVWITAHGMTGVFAFMLVENMGVPFPTELGFITAQGLISAGHVSFWEAFAVITGGHLLGAGITYYAGRAGDSALGRWFSHRQRLTAARDQMQAWYAKYGAFALLFGRLVGQVRPWSSLIAGMARVRPLQFWTWTVLGSLLYSLIAMWFTVGGFALWNRYPSLHIPMIIAVIAVFYGSMVVALGHRWLTRRRARAAATAPAEADPSSPE